MKNRSTVHPLRFLSLVVIAYMLMAFTWWSVLLFTKNRDAFEAKKELLLLGMIAEGVVHSRSEFVHTSAFIALEKSYQRQEWMILGEGAVFILSLVAGIWFINRGYQKEVNAVNSRRNFLLSITHELKSPLTSIRLVLETLIKRKQLPQDQVEKLSRGALAESERLQTLVENLLLSAKLDATYTPDRTPLNLSELLKELEEKIRGSYPDASFTISIPDDLPLWAGDKAGFTSIALNLLENAVKYSSESPHIHTELFYQQHPPGFVFRVADQGVGIADKEKKRVFERFYRVGNEDTRQTKGTGLGLYIAEQIVKAHHGRIKILDNTPKGTIFQVFLPDA